jgi:hypothetical protein
MGRDRGSIQRHLQLTMGEGDESFVALMAEMAKWGSSCSGQSRRPAILSLQKIVV